MCMVISHTDYKGYLPEVMKLLDFKVAVAKSLIGSRQRNTPTSYIVPYVSKNSYKYVTNLEATNLCLDGNKIKTTFFDNNITVHFAPENDRDTRVLQHKLKDVINLKEPN